MIACMVMNQSDDPLVKTNLILAPTALLDQVRPTLSNTLCLYRLSFFDLIIQWKLEIEMKTNTGLSCHIYHGPL
jgi:hypothetical protein